MRNYCRKCGEEIKPHEGMIDGMHEQFYDELQGRIEDILIKEDGEIGAVMDMRGGK
jgi:hypothetical protein